MLAEFNLTEEEIRVAKEVCKGLSNKEIAKATGKSPDTVKHQVQSSIKKTGALNRTALACILLLNKLVTLQPEELVRTTKHTIYGLAMSVVWTAALSSLFSSDAMARARTNKPPRPSISRNHRSRARDQFDDMLSHDTQAPDWPTLKSCLFQRKQRAGALK